MSCAKFTISNDIDKNICNLKKKIVLNNFRDKKNLIREHLKIHYKKGYHKIRFTVAYNICLQKYSISYYSNFFYFYFDNGLRANVNKNKKKKEKKGDTRRLYELFPAHFSIFY